MKLKEKDSKPNAIQAALSYVLSHAWPAVRLIGEGISGISERPKLRQASALTLVMAVIVGLVFLGPLGSLSPTLPALVPDQGADSYTIDPVPDNSTVDGTVDVPVDGSSEEPADSQTTTVPDSQTTTVPDSQTTTVPATQTTTVPATQTTTVPDSQPTIRSVSPSQGTHGQTLEVTVTGTCFERATAVTISGITVNSFAVDSDTQVTANIFVPAITPGPKNVRVYTPQGTAVLYKGFTVLAEGSAVETYCTIKASADAHGSISPSGTVSVTYGSDQSFAIVPDADYRIKDVLVDGSSVGAVNAFTFSNVTKNHTIAAYTTPTTPYTTPTLVVAASNSSDKSDADYICDGSNDQVQINEAIDDLPSSGGVVQLLNGSYYIGSSSYVDLTSAVTLKGQGTATILVKSSPSGGSSMICARSSTAPHANVCISSLRINLGSPSSAAFLVEAYDADYLTLEDVQFTCSSRHGMILVRDSNHVTMDDCIFDGIQIQVSGETSSSAKDDTKINSEDVLVQGCTFRNSPDGEFALGNVVKKWRIIDNYFYDCGFTAIDIANSPDSIISGNTIDGCAHNGIYSEGGRRLTVKNNTVLNVEDTGILSNMDIYGYGQGGDVLIQNNVLADCYLAIASFGVPRVTITGNEIDGTKWHAIYLSTSTVYGVEYHPDDCVIYDNQVSDFGQEHSYSAGIALIDCEGCEVYTNVIDGDYNTYAANGIKEGGDADYNTIYENTITGVQVAAIKTVGSHTTVD